MNDFEMKETSVKVEDIIFTDVFSKKDLLQSFLFSAYEPDKK